MKFVPGFVLCCPCAIGAPYLKGNPPQSPSTPLVPDVPDVPDVPQVPDVPDVPDVPLDPLLPLEVTTPVLNEIFTDGIVSFSGLLTSVDIAAYCGISETGL